MTPAFVGTWLAAAGFGLVAPALLRRAHPTWALWLLSVGGLLLAVTTTATLAAAAAPWAGRLPFVAGVGRWSAPALGHRHPVPPAVLVLALTMLALTVVGVLRAAAGDGRRLVAAWRIAAGSNPGLVVTGEAEPVAYALPGWPGRVVVSRGLLRRLDADGRRAVLAHERVHLRQRHDLHVLAARLAAGANPLLGGLPGAVRAASERQADEHAAAVVGDRRTVAHAIATAVGVRPAPVLAAAGADVPQRVLALLAPSRPGPVAAAGRLGVPLLLLAAALVSALTLAHQLDGVLDLAQTTGH